MRDRFATTLSLWLSPGFREEAFNAMVRDPAIQTGVPLAEQTPDEVVRMRPALAGHFLSFRHDPC